MTPVGGLPPPLMVPREALRPPSADSPRTGLLMSLLAHGGLLAALAFGVHWRTEEPAAVSAELWSSVPQIAAPPRPEPTPSPAPEPPPPPAPSPAPSPAPRISTPPPAPPPAAEREADIALEKAKRLREEQARQAAEAQREKALKAQREQAEKARLDKVRAEQEKAERLKAQQKAEKEQAEKQKADKERAERLEAQRRDKAAEAQREKLRQEQMKRMADQLGGPSGSGAPGSTGSAARDAGPSANYAGRILARVKPNIVLTEEVPGNPRAEVEMVMAPDGTILKPRIRQSSGSKVWDDAVLRAVERTGILPRDTDGKVPPTIVIGFRPRD